MPPTREQAFDDFVPPALDVLDETIYTALSSDEVEVFVDFLERIAARARELLNR